MRLISCAVGVLFLLSCGTTTENADTEKASFKEPIPPVQHQTSTRIEAAKPVPTSANENEEEQFKITGTWENSSCGERHYRRQISFKEGGTFVAIDEVAPCPPKAQCVWSGIINWQGQWTQNGLTIALNTELPKAGKMPERVPAEFVILNGNPLSIGEKDNTVICPYQRRR